MEEALNRTIQEELDWDVQQMHTGVLQLKLSPEQALNHTPAATPQASSTDCGHIAHEECSRSLDQPQSGFQFSFAVPKGVSDDPTEIHPAYGRLNFETADTRRQSQAGSCDAVNEDSDQVVEEEKLKIFTKTKSQDSEFKFNFAIPEADAELQLGECTRQPVPAVQNIEAKADPMLPSHQKAKQLVASRPSQKNKNKARSSKLTAEPMKGGERQSGESDGRERNSTAHREGQCLSSEEQLRREVGWCIEQLELGLRTQKAKQKQADRALNALRTLRSEKAPLVKKRQVMRSIFGDYRKKMEEEWQKQFKFMIAATKSANIKPVGLQTKSKVFRKSMSKLTKDDTDPESMNSERSTIQCMRECDQRPLSV